MPQQFSDHFAISNLSLQERLGRSATALNKDSAVFGQQTRSLLQMLNYGLDAITARAATHLLNMDVLYSNDAYLLKLSEGLLLNSIRSITPPKINSSSPFRFWSERSYTRWNSIGTISLKNGTKTNLIVYDIQTIGSVEGSETGTEYKALYCAGDFVQQTISNGFDEYTTGIFAPVYISETYKSIWSESVEVTLDMGDEGKRGLLLAWSLDELLGMPDNSYAALIQHTPRGMTLTLGDGEIFGKGYNGSHGTSKINNVIVTYVKCESLAPVDHSTIKFNRDVSIITPHGDSVPVLSPMDTGDTPDELRSRAVAAFFSASKITNERDLVTEVTKIPFVKSCYARRECNWPVFSTASKLWNGYSDYTKGLNTADSNFYSRYQYKKGNVYNPGDIVVYGKSIYMCKVPGTKVSPTMQNYWVNYMSIESASAVSTLYDRYMPSTNIYDNATIVLSGLVMRNRRYWNPQGTYYTGDVVYHSGTKQLWLAIRDGGSIVEPGNEGDRSIYDSDRYWVTREDAKVLEESMDTSSTHTGLTLKFDDYEQLTQAMFESEIKGYFNLSQKLGFVSVVVEPLGICSVTVNASYTAPASIQQEVRSIITDYVCYNVGKTLKADVLNSILTEKFNLSSVYVTITMNMDSPVTGMEVNLPTATYVPPSMLEINLAEHIGIQ